MEESKVNLLMVMKALGQESRNHTRMQHALRSFSARAICVKWRLCNPEWWQWTKEENGNPANYVPQNQSKDMSKESLHILKRTSTCLLKTWLFLLGPAVCKMLRPTGWWESFSSFPFRTVFTEKCILLNRKSKLSSETQVKPYLSLDLHEDLCLNTLGVDAANPFSCL